jgi:hypothetical protein
MKIIPQSRNEFCQLQLETRRQREVNRVMAEMIAQESWFQDCRWNLDDSAFLRKRHFSVPTCESPEVIFRDWRRISLGESSSPAQQDAYDVWMKNLKPRADKSRRTNPHVEGNECTTTN